MNDDNHKTLQEFAMGEIIKELRAERDALKAERDKLLNEIPEGCTAADARVLREENHKLVAQLEEARKQAPYAEWKIFNKGGSGQFGQLISNHPMHDGLKLYASPVPAQQECTFHGEDAQACMDYSKEVPCEFTWEQEAKRAFWSGLEIGASFGSCAILPRWNEYIDKRKSELKGGENER